MKKIKEKVLVEQKPIVREFIYKDDELQKLKRHTDINKDLIREVGKITRSSGNGKFHFNNEYATLKELNIVHTDIQPDTIVHENYIKLLDRAYSADYGIEIKPDFIWFTILSEMARMVNKDPEKFRQYFTTRTKEESKELIIAHCGSDNVLDVDSISEQLFLTMPNYFTEELIVPKFTTLTEESSFAFKTAFLKTVSPYYSYGTYYCGYNKVKVYGEISDYELMIKTLNTIENLVPDFNEYIKQCTDVITDVISNWDNEEFWSLICKTDEGYGDRVFDGWFTRFFHSLRRSSSWGSSSSNSDGERVEKKNYIRNGFSSHSFPTHMIKVDYTNVETEEKFSLYSGIFSSIVEDGYVKPQFNKIVVKK